MNLIVLSLHTVRIIMLGTKAMFPASRILITKHEQL